MPEQRPDTVTELADVMRSHYANPEDPEAFMRVLLASGLVLPAADVIPKQDVFDRADALVQQGVDYTGAISRELRTLVAGGES